MKRFFSTGPVSVPRLAAVLFVLVAAALLLDNYTYLFRTSLYEFEDLAADSLQITRAKHFHELYGQYSRWGFHHPGPGFFYVQGWGELLFHDWLRLVPRPLNGQMLATVLLNVFFVAATLATATGWMGRKTLFLPLALLLGVIHVSAIKFSSTVPLGALLMTVDWPAYVNVVPFAALIVVGASVAAGRGESLPLLALTCCFLEHSHVAQPLFIVPVSLLAYAGLTFACRRREPDAAGGSRAPWRVYPRAHRLAAVCLGIFLLPLLIDACWGTQSNLAKIVGFYQRTHGHEKPKKLIRAFLYFVQFALYDSYNPDQGGIFGDYTAQGMKRFLLAHRLTCELWVGSLLGASAVMLSWWRQRPAVPAEGADAETAAREAGFVRARRRFIVWWWVMAAVAFVLTLHWGRIMNGEMCYYNAFFNFGLIYAVLLALAAVASDYLAQFGVGRGAGARVFLYALLVPLFVTESASFQPGIYAADPVFTQIGRTIDAALRAAGPSTRPIMLTFFMGGYDRVRTNEVALELTRRGLPYIVEKRAALFFPPEHVKEDAFLPPADPRHGPPFRTWQIIAPPFANLSLGTCVWPLVDPGFCLVTGEREIDPAAGVAVSFGDGQRDSVNVAPVGWQLPDKGAVASWNYDRYGQISFRAHPVADGAAVRLTLNAVPFIVPGRLDAQRVEISFNGKPLGTWTRREPGAFDVTIPAAAWNAQTDAWLTFHFPDGAEPARLGLNPDDHRLLAFAFATITFALQ